MSEPDLSIHHAELKIIWANQLINKLDAEIKSFIERKPYSISLEPEPNADAFLLRVDLSEGIPFLIPCLIGDICNNLRSSIDTCWMGLQRSINPSCRRSYFPIRSQEVDLEKEVIKTMEGQDLKKMMTILDQIKPHHEFESGGNKHLISLNELNNWQKHNMLVPAFGVTRLGENTVISSNDGSTIELSRALVNGRVAGIGGTKADMTYDSDPAVEVFVNANKLGGHHPAIPLLMAFKDVAIDCLNCFKREFSNP